MICFLIWFFGRKNGIIRMVVISKNNRLFRLIKRCCMLVFLCYELVYFRLNRNEVCLLILMKVGNVLNFG